MGGWASCTLCNTVKYVLNFHVPSFEILTRVSKPMQVLVPVGSVTLECG